MQLGVVRERVRAGRGAQLLDRARSNSSTTACAEFATSAERSAPIAARRPRPVLPAAPAVTRCGVCRTPPGIESHTRPTPDGRCRGAQADEAEVALFRALQEALSNVARHAGNAPANVEIHATSGEVTMRVTDRGPGFDGEGSLARLEAEGHLGLAGMRERITALGGEITVKSAPGEGVVIMIRIPVTEGSAL